MAITFANAAQDVKSDGYDCTKETSPTTTLAAAAPAVGASPSTTVARPPAAGAAPTSRARAEVAPGAPATPSDAGTDVGKPDRGRVQAESKGREEEEEASLPAATDDRLTDLPRCRRRQWARQCGLGVGHRCSDLAGCPGSFVSQRAKEATERQVGRSAPLSTSFLCNALEYCLDSLMTGMAVISLRNLPAAFRTRSREVRSRRSSEQLSEMRRIADVEKQIGKVGRKNLGYPVDVGADDGDPQARLSITTRPKAPRDWAHRQRRQPS